MNLRTFLAAVARYWKTFGVVAGAVFALVLSWLLLTPAAYVSTTQLMVSITGSTTASAYQNDEIVGSRINSYIALLSSDVVSQRVVDKLGLSMTAPQLAAEINATNVPPRTSIIDVSVSAASPEQAQRIAGTLAEQFISYTSAIETPTGEDGQQVHTTVVSAASQPRGQLLERVALGVLAALVGLLMGGVAVWIRALVDPVVRSAYRAAPAAGVPVLGCVTQAAAVSTNDLDGYRRLRTRLRPIAPTGGCRIVEITSATGEVDTTAVALSLGRAMELAGTQTIVLDAGLPVSEVAELVTGGVDIDSPGDRGADGDGWLQPQQGPDGFADQLRVRAWADDPDLIATSAAAQLINRLRNDYQQVVIAAAPVLSTMATSVLSDYADAVLLVVSLGTTSTRDLHRAAEILRATGAELTGLVLVCEGNQEIEVMEQKDGHALGSGH